MINCLLINVYFERKNMKASGHITKVTDISAAIFKLLLFSYWFYVFYYTAFSSNTRVKKYFSLAQFLCSENYYRCLYFYFFLAKNIFVVKRCVFESLGRAISAIECDFCKGSIGNNSSFAIEKNAVSIGCHFWSHQQSHGERALAVRRNTSAAIDKSASHGTKNKI